MEWEWGSAQPLGVGCGVSWRGVRMDTALLVAPRAVSNACCKGRAQRRVALWRVLQMNPCVTSRVCVQARSTARSCAVFRLVVLWLSQGFLAASRLLTRKFSSTVFHLMSRVPGGCAASRTVLVSERHGGAVVTLRWWFLPCCWQLGLLQLAGHSASLLCFVVAIAQP